MFRTQHTDPQAAPQAVVRSYTGYAAAVDAPEASQMDTSSAGPSPFLCLADLLSVALDIKNTLTAAIADLKADLKAVATRVETCGGGGHDAWRGHPSGTASSVYT